MTKVGRQISNLFPLSSVFRLLISVSESTDLWADLTNAAGKITPLWVNKDFCCVFRPLRWKERLKVFFNFYNRSRRKMAFSCHCEAF
ncbi:MAG: hypothetical protein A2Z25_23125 [Planctomycetes bacterium RBG_16_55_9]|nr:MAG: hypothetical protein A2Z25_23125 [Planctomycetes bacterium RBG_16_55_9]